MRDISREIYHERYIKRDISREIGPISREIYQERYIMRDISREIYQEIFIKRYLSCVFSRTINDVSCNFEQVQKSNFRQYQVFIKLLCIKLLPSECVNGLEYCWNILLLHVMSLFVNCSCMLVAIISSNHFQMTQNVRFEADLLDVQTAIV